MEFIPMNTISDRYYIYVNREVVGVLEYTIYEEELEIKYIKIHEEYRRMGIATRVVKALKNKCEYIIGDALPEAVEFWKSMNAEFYEPFDNDEVILTPFIIR
jgi:GNAT superfamily N-acetyltransferase